MRYLKSLLKGLSLTCLTFAVVSFFMAKAPYYHRTMLRKFIGPKILTIEEGKSGGSAFFVKLPSGKTGILTNKHVCKLSKDKKNIHVRIDGENELYSRKILKMDDNHDLCLIETLDGFEGLSMGSELDIGENIAIMGHPSLRPLTVSIGEFIGKRYINLPTDTNVSEDQCKGKLIRLDPIRALVYGFETVCIETFRASQLVAYTREGSSGSPVVNFWGNVVGVLFAGSNDDVLDSYAVPLQNIRNFLENM